MNKPVYTTMEDWIKALEDEWGKDAFHLMTEESWKSEWERIQTNSEEI